MTEMELNSLGVISVGKIAAVIYAIIGIIWGVMALMMGVATLPLEGFLMGIVAVIGGIIVGAIGGFIGGIIFALLYNAASSIIGGITVDLEESRFS